MNYMTVGKPELTTLKIVDCSICGKIFLVKIRKDGYILTDCWHNNIDLNYFDGWNYELLDNNKLKPVYKNRFYKIIGFCKPTRSIYYFLRQLFHKKAILEIWECSECANRPDD